MWLLYAAAGVCYCNRANPRQPASAHYQPQTNSNNHEQPRHAPTYHPHPPQKGIKKGVKKGVNEPRETPGHRPNYPPPGKRSGGTSRDSCPSGAKQQQQQPPATETPCSPTPSRPPNNTLHSGSCRTAATATPQHRCGKQPPLLPTPTNPHTPKRSTHHPEPPKPTQPKRSQS